VQDACRGSQEFAQLRHNRTDTERHEVEGFAARFSWLLGRDGGGTRRGSLSCARLGSEQRLDIARQALKGIAREENFLRRSLELSAASLEDERLMSLGVEREAPKRPEYFDRAVQVLWRDAKRQRVGIVGRDESPPTHDERRRAAIQALARPAFRSLLGQQRFHRLSDVSGLAAGNLPETRQTDELGPICRQKSIDLSHRGLALVLRQQTKRITCSGGVSGSEGLHATVPQSAYDDPRGHFGRRRRLSRLLTKTWTGRCRSA
jgi:hypothetical protein